MIIKRREMKRSDWKRITKRKYATKNISVSGCNGVAGLILMEEVSAPLDKNGVRIVGEGYKWLQIALENQNFWATAMFDENDDFIQIYFDITLGNYFDDPQNPKFDDLFVDIVLTTDLKIQILDFEELEQALKEKVITKERFLLAKTTTEKLSKYLENYALDIIGLCKSLTIQLLSENND